MKVSLPLFMFGKLICVLCSLWIWCGLLILGKMLAQSPPIQGLYHGNVSTLNCVIHASIDHLLYLWVSGVNGIVLLGWE